MKRATFENSVDVLVKAYMNNTLEPMDCQACAVGNLIAASGYVFTDQNKNVWSEAASVIRRLRLYGVDRKQTYDLDVASNQADCAGYSLEELELIESAFMSWGPTYPAFTRVFDPTDTDIFMGLLRVVDMLAEIHGVGLSTKQQAVGQFQEVQSQKVGA